MKQLQLLSIILQEWLSDDSSHMEKKAPDLAIYIVDAMDFIMEDSEGRGINTPEAYILHRLVTVMGELEAAHEDDAPDLTKDKELYLSLAIRYGLLPLWKAVALRGGTMDDVEAAKEGLLARVTGERILEPE